MTQSSNDHSESIIAEIVETIVNKENSMFETSFKMKGSLHIESARYNLECTVGTHTWKLECGFWTVFGWTDNFCTHLTRKIALQAIWLLSRMIFMHRTADNVYSNDKVVLQTTHTHTQISAKHFPNELWSFQQTGCWCLGIRFTIVHCICHSFPRVCGLMALQKSAFDELNHK